MLFKTVSESMKFLADEGFLCETKKLHKNVTQIEFTKKSIISITVDEYNKFFYIELYINSGGHFFKDNIFNYISMNEDATKERIHTLYKKSKGFFKSKNAHKRIIELYIKMIKDLIEDKNIFNF